MVPVGAVMSMPQEPLAAQGPSSAYHSTDDVMKPGVLPRPVVKVAPPPIGTISVRSLELSYRSTPSRVNIVPASHRPSAVLVAPYHHSDRSTLEPVDGVHSVRAPDMVAHTNRSLAIQVPPEDDEAVTNF